MNTDKLSGIALVVAIVALILSCVTLLGGHPGGKVGGTTNYDTGAFSGLQVGTNCNNGFATCLGSLMSSNNFGTTTLIGSGSNIYQITASTTKNIDFACPNVTLGDSVEAFWAPTTTVAVTGEGWRIVTAQASTTAGFCTAMISNDSGTTATIPNGFASSTGYRALH